jgi:hypothetical protein
MSVTPASLAARFRAGINCSPSSQDVSEFEQDLEKVELLLMDQALVEVNASGTMGGRPTDEARLTVMRVYCRKVAEQATLFPVFHTFESAYRSALGRWMEAHYGDAQWWGPIDRKLASGQQAITVTAINGVPLPSNAARDIGRMLERIEGNYTHRNGKVARLATGADVLREAILADVQNLILDHWSAFSKHLHVPRAPRPAASKRAFEDQYTKVREARNTAYHHKPVANRPDVVRAVENLLDYIDVDLVSALDAAELTSIRPYQRAIPLEARHAVTPGLGRTFRLAGEIYRNSASLGRAADLSWHRVDTVQAISAQEAIWRFMDCLDGHEKSCCGGVRLL